MRPIKLTLTKITFTTILLVGLIALTGNDVQAEETTSLWKVTSKEGGPIIYLAGSIHLLSEDDHPLPAPFEAAYRASDKLVLEISSADDVGSETVALEKGMYGKERKISDDLSPEMYMRLKDFLEGSGLPPTAMDGFRPWMAAMTISITEIMKMGGRPELGVDSFFENRAIKDGKPVKGLETTEFQIGLFAKLDIKEQEKMLASTLKEMATVETDFPKMVKAWRDGDDDTVGRIMNESMALSPEFRKELLDNRNRNWVKRLDELMKGEHDIMVVVGAAHLVGDQGLVKLLRAAGFRVDRWSVDVKKKPESKPKKKDSRFIPVSI